jgi:SNF2 family DNA or RNA helicase
MKIPEIDIDDSGNLLLINVDNEILNNRSYKIVFNRLNVFIEEEKIKVPVNNNTLELVDQITKLFKNNEIDIVYSEKLKKILFNFDREKEYFKEFSENAFRIKNDQFKDYPDLVSKFDLFKHNLKKNFKRDLYLLQELSAFHIAFSQNACNFSVPGAGKTTIVYAAYSYLKNLPKEDPLHVDYLFVIGPLSSFYPWENEYLKCFGVKPNVKRLSGDLKITKSSKKEHLYSSSPSELTLIFHGGVDKLQEEIIDFLKRNKTMIVVDEAHRIKNPEGIWGSSITNISKEAISRVVLTGTPVPNGYEDLYNLYKFIYPYKYKEILGFSFQNLIKITEREDFEETKIEQFKSNISPFFIRIKKSDLKLPPIKENVIRIEMDDVQKKIYEYIESEYVTNDFINNPSATVKDTLNKARLIRLRQAATNISLLSKSLKNSMVNNNEDFDPNSVYTTINDDVVDDSYFFSLISNYYSLEVPNKFIEIKKIIDDKISKNEKVLIWTIFIQNAKQLQEFLNSYNIKSKLLIGEIEQSEREETISKFNNPTNSDFLITIANPFSVSESISLHNGCHCAIYLERDYNCSNFLQSKDRIHRVGIEKDQLTEYYYLISDDTIDEQISRGLESKIERMENIINDDIPLFSRLDDEDESDIIREIIKKYAK